MPTGPLSGADLTLPPPTSDPATRAGRKRIVARFSGHEARTIEVVPRQLQLRDRLGYIELDLTRATFEPGLTTIDVGAFIGYVQIRLPPSVRVENSGRALVGLSSLSGGQPEDAPQAESVVRLTGRAVFGFAECVIARAQGGTVAEA